MGVSLKGKISVKKYDFRNLMKDIIPKIDYATHCIHQYTAKLIPHIPRYFIEKYTQKNDTVLDPFCGSGTTLLEAKLSGRNAIGIDINPLAVLIAEVKTTPLDIDKLNLAINLVKERIRNEKGSIQIEFPNIDYWFCREAKEEICKIISSLKNLRSELDEEIYKFLLVCLSSVIRKSSYADPRIAKTFKSKRMKEKIKSGWIPAPINYFGEALDRNFERIRSFPENANLHNNYVRVFHGDARETQSILTLNGFEKVDFVITSPPYINAQDYFRSYKLELWWLGLATPDETMYLSKKAIGTEKVSSSEYNYNSMPKSEISVLNTIIQKIWCVDKKKSYIVYKYFEDMGKVFEEVSRVLKIDGYFCLITGCNNICGFSIPTYRILIQIAEKKGFKLIEVGRDNIKNRTLPPNRKYNSGIIKEEWITVFRKSH